MAIKLPESVESSIDRELFRFFCRTLLRIEREALLLPSSVDAGLGRIILADVIFLAIALIRPVNAIYSNHARVISNRHMAVSK
jgi:hypothetical protein